MERTQRCLFRVSLLMTACGIALLGGRVYVSAKAGLAAFLIDRAYAAHLRDGRPHRPWRWADLHPVARLEVPRTGVSRAILTGATGSSLAFGLGHVSGTADPGDPGNSAVAGHRDTWASFMRDLRPGDVVWLETAEGRWRYTVTRTQVVPQHRVDILDPTETARLTLITCYPFSGLFRSPWRFVVICERDRTRVTPYPPGDRE